MNNEELIKENLLLKEEIDLLKEKLKNYTAPKRSKKFYETHKEEIKQKVREYKENVFINAVSETKSFQVKVSADSCTLNTPSQIVPTAPPLKPLM